MIAAAAVELSCTAAYGQRLRFESPAAPGPNRGEAARLLADELQARIDRDARLTADDARVRAASGLRSLARALLLRGEELGEPGSPHVLAGRTLAAHAGQMEGAMAKLAGDEPALVIASADLERAAAFIPPDPAAMDRLLRDALAVLLDTLAPAPGPAGWVDGPAAPLPPAADEFDAAITAWAASPGMSESATAALRRIGATLREGEGWMAYARASARMRSLISAAAMTFDTSRPAASVADASARLSLALRFVAAVEALGQDLSDEHALAELERLSRIARLFDLLAVLAERSGRARRESGVTTAVVQTLAAPPADPVESLRRIAALERAVALIAAAEGAGGEDRLLRPLRPAHRFLSAAARRAGAAVYDGLPRLAQNADAMNDPGMASAIASLRRAVDDLSLVERLSAALAAPAGDGPAREPSVAPGMDRVVNRLLDLSQDFEKPQRGEAALVAWRAFATLFIRASRMAGEGAIAADAGALEPFTGGRGADLLARVRESKEAWIGAWSKDPESGEAASAGRAVAALADLLAMLNDAAAVRDGWGPLNAWAGWELSDRAADKMLDGLEAELAAATERALVGAAPGLEGDVAKIAEERALVRLVAALEREAGTLGLAAPAAGVAELGTGGPYPERSWLHAERAALAAVCRYVEEWAGGEGEAAEQAGEYAKMRASDVLRAINGL